jgi:hypothetical protein
MFWSGHTWKFSHAIRSEVFADWFRDRMEATDVECEIIVNQFELMHGAA